MVNEFFKIEIEGRQFKKAYLIYIVKLTSSNLNFGEYYYIGQTGDRNHFTARPAFRRLAGHFSDQGNSTENQIYKAIVSVILNKNYSKGMPFDPDVKNSVTEFLINSTIEMFVYPIKAFSESDSKEDHETNRKNVEKIETELIHHFIETYGKESVLNKKIPKIVPSKEVFTQEIIDHFNDRTER
jgi:hypothetical protein